MKEFKVGDRVVVYGPGMHWSSASGDASSRRIGVITEPPRVAENGQCYLAVRLAKEWGTAFHIKQCRHLIKKGG